MLTDKELIALVNLFDFNQDDMWIEYNYEPYFIKYSKN